MSLPSRFGFIASQHFILRVFSSIFLIAGAFILTWYGGYPFNSAWVAIAGLVAFEWWRIVRAGCGIWLGVGLLYVFLVAAGPILIRHDLDLGFKALIWAFVIIWTTDIMAYIFGRSLGGPKLWPVVSPNKTWSGFLGGVCSGALLGIVLAVFWIKVPNIVPVAFLAALAALATQGGDLFESFVKRQFSVKDSGNIIPGHGGVMDRLDGCIIACGLLAAIGVAHRGFAHAAQGILIW